MFGRVVNYHYLKAEPNASPENDCVYQFLLHTYGSRHITKHNLLEIFGESRPTAGVSTKQLATYCKRFGISLYALDTDCNVFYYYAPAVRSHKLTSLMYVVANYHMYPVVDQSLRKCIFANKNKCEFAIKRKSETAKMKKSAANTVLNPEDLNGLTNVNVVFTVIKTLLPQVNQLFLSEKTI